jgi:hypothetical protein
MGWSVCPSPSAAVGGASRSLEAGVGTDRSEMQLLRDEVVRNKLSNEAESEDLPSAHLCSLPEEFVTQVHASAG